MNHGKNMINSTFYEFIIYRFFLPLSTVFLRSEVRMKPPKEYIIFPLDLPDYDQAMSYVDLLKEHVGLFKVGLELFISQGPPILEAIRDAAGKARVFLDLKLQIGCGKSRAIA